MSGACRLRFGRELQSCVAGWVIVVVVTGVVGRIGCLSLLPVKSLSIASHFEQSS